MAMDADKAKKVIEEGEKIIKDSGIDEKIKEVVKKSDSSSDSSKAEEAKSAIKDIADKLKK